MGLQGFLDQLRVDPESIEFTDTIALIDSTYEYTPASFSNGEQHNSADQNAGSCKIFAFAKLNNLSETETLHCFGKYYREEVLNDPNGKGHQNIRQFIKNGFDGIKFDGEPLRCKA